MEDTIKGNRFSPSSDLIMSFMTLRNATLYSRVQAAAIAGFKGIGWRLDDFENAESEGFDESKVIEILNSSGISASEIEFFRNWVGLENQRAYRDKEGKLFDLAKKVGAKHINVAVFEDEPFEKVVGSFTLLCRRASESNLLVQLEFMPYTPAINTFQKAWDVVRESNEENSGLLIDAWHWARTHSTEEMLTAVPAERVTGIQLSDILNEPMADSHQESLHFRRIPGTGSFNLPAFLNMLSNYGVKADLSVEILSDELDKLPSLKAASDAAEYTRLVLWKTIFG